MKPLDAITRQANRNRLELCCLMGFNELPFETNESIISEHRQFREQLEAVTNTRFKDLAESIEWDFKRRGMGENSKLRTGFGHLLCVENIFSACAGWVIHNVDELLENGSITNKEYAKIKEMVENQRLSYK